VSEQLLNLTIVEKLSQLEGRIPGFIQQQLGAIEKHWLRDFEELNTLIISEDYSRSKALLHHMRGALGMFGMSKLCACLEELEVKLEKTYGLSAWEIDKKNLANIKIQSCEAARRCFSTLQN
jgi:HPt (histidine-containing phosphotransfer) domain-containing protein